VLESNAGCPTSIIAAEDGRKKREREREWRDKCVRSEISAPCKPVRAREEWRDGERSGLQRERKERMPDNGGKRGKSWRSGGRRENVRK